MKALANIVLVVGIISMAVGVVLRIMVREAALGLAPSSFLEFSIACFLLTIALGSIEK